MSEDKNKKAVGKISPKKVRARKKADGSIEILEEVKTSTPEEKLEDSTFSDRDALLDEFLRESGVSQEDEK